MNKNYPYNNNGDCFKVALNSIKDSANECFNVALKSMNIVSSELLIIASNGIKEIFQNMPSLDIDIETLKRNHEKKRYELDSMEQVLSNHEWEHLPLELAKIRFKQKTRYAFIVLITYFKPIKIALLIIEVIKSKSFNTPFNPIQRRTETVTILSVVFLNL